MNNLEYAFYTENFEIFQFKFKTYGCGKWAKTYDEAHELAKEAVLKKCMEENPHLAFQNKNEVDKWIPQSSLNMQVTAPPQRAFINGSEILSKKIDYEQPTVKGIISTTDAIKKEMSSYKLGASIFKNVYEKIVKGNKELEEIYNEKLSQLRK